VVSATNVIPIRPQQGVSSPLTIVVSETIDQGAANLVNHLKVPNLLITTISEYPSLEILEPKSEIFLSLDVTKISPEELKLMVDKCNPTQLVLHNLHIPFERDYKKRNWVSLTTKAREYVNRIQDIARVPVTLIGTSESIMIDLR
jgi:adenylosuccinate synthase